MVLLAHTKVLYWSSNDSKKNKEQKNNSKNLLNDAKIDTRWIDMKSISTSAVSCRVLPNIFIIFFSVAHLCISTHYTHTKGLPKWQQIYWWCLWVRLDTYRAFFAYIADMDGPRIDDEHYSIICTEIIMNQRKWTFSFSAWLFFFRVTRNCRFVYSAYAIRLFRKPSPTWLIADG